MEELVGDQESIETAVQGSLANSFERWGLELVSLQISGFNLPPEYQMLQKKVFGGKIRKTEIAVDTDTSMAELESQETLASTKAANMHKVDMQMKRQTLEAKKAELELEAQEQELDLMKAQLEVKKAKVSAAKRAVERETEALDETSQIQTEENRGLAQTRVKKASVTIDEEIAQQEQDHEYQMHELDTSSNYNSVDQFATNAKKMVKSGVMRDASMGGYSQGIGNQVRIDEIRTQIQLKEDKLASLDDLLAQGKLSQELYEQRSKLLLAQIETLNNELNQLLN